MARALEMMADLRDSAAKARAERQTRMDGLIDPRACCAPCSRRRSTPPRPRKRAAAFLPAPPKGRTIVVGAGKAAASMAAAVEAALARAARGPRRHPLRPWRADQTHRGRRGRAIPCPTPPAQPRRCAILDLVRGLTADDLVLCLISGGGSALLAAAAPGLTLADKQAINRALLTSGADIGEMNCVRKHLSAIKGGRLALAAAPARVVSLIISDVPGDDLSIIASGPTVADATHPGRRARDPRAAIASTPPRAVLAHLQSPRRRRRSPAIRASPASTNILIATPQMSLEAAAEVARAAGVTPRAPRRRDRGRGARGRQGHGGHRAARRRSMAQPARAPCVLLSGGETTVTVRGKGRGGRNAEFLLGLAIALDGAAGSTRSPATPTASTAARTMRARSSRRTRSRAPRRAGLDPRARLADNDAYSPSRRSAISW